jgi:hypothetical protein
VERGDGGVMDTGADPGACLDVYGAKSKTEIRFEDHHLIEKRATRILVDK